MEKMPVKLENIVGLCFESIFTCSVGLFNYSNTWNNNLGQKFLVKVRAYTNNVYLMVWYFCIFYDKKIIVS